MFYASHFRTFLLWIIAFFCYALISACSTLPTKKTQTIPTKVDDIALQQTQFAQKIAPLRLQYPDLTGYHLLANPAEALSARLSLIQQAEKTLDVQYYIWHNDKIGTLTFHALMNAADRGVHVRLLIDDNNAKQIEGILLALSQHRNIEVKLFNPYRFRKYRAMDMVLDLKRINRRMHNKSLIADRQLSIIGGRNISNEYFNVSHEFQFADIDVLLLGQANDEIATAFDEYWQHDYAYDVQDVVKVRHHSLQYTDLKQQLEQQEQGYIQQQDPIYKVIQENTSTFQYWLNHEFSFEWVKAKVLKDSAKKINDQAPPDQYLYPQLMQHMDQPKQTVDIISAYFIPQDQGVQTLSDLEASGVDVRVVSNSYQSTDVKGVHAYYSKYRKDLLKNGVEIYEFLPITLIDEFMNSQQEVTQKKRTQQTEHNTEGTLLRGSNHSSLHAKTFILDQKQVFIGSLNLDPRSVHYNTEIGVLLNSPTLATTLHQAMNNKLHHYTWQVILKDHQLQWVKPVTDPNPPPVLKKEPKMKWWQRMTNKMLSWVPLEHMF